MTGWFGYAMQIGTGLGGFFTVVMVVVLLWQVRVLRRELAADLYCRFAGRYADIISRFPENINSAEFDLERVRLSDNESYKAVMRAMRNYFDLCYEEWTLGRRKWVNKDMAREWAADTKSAMNKRAFADAWQVVKQTTDYKPEFTEYIEAL